MRKIWSRARTSNGLLTRKQWNSNHVLHDVLSGRAVKLGTRLGAALSVRRYCWEHSQANFHLPASTGAFSLTLWSLALRRDLKLAPSISGIIKRLKYAGIIHYWFETALMQLRNATHASYECFLRAINGRLSSTRNRFIQSVSLDCAISTFTLLIGSFILTLIVLILEKIYDSYFKGYRVSKNIVPMVP